SEQPLLQNMLLFQAICPGSLWARDNRWLLSRVQRLAGPAGGQGPFVPVGDTNRDKMGAFCPGWWFQPGQKARVLLELKGVKVIRSYRDFFQLIRNFLRINDFVENKCIFQ